VEKGVLTEEEFSFLNFAQLAAFWSGTVGKSFIQESDHLERELPFTLRLDRADTQRLLPGWSPGLEGDDFVVVQGIADLAVIQPSEIWLLDFKTDSIASERVPAYVDKYRVQILLYAHALEAIYARPVTKKFLHFFAPGVTAEVK
jgi:ATP-dependent helicase/nuclease subunit A